MPCASATDSRRGSNWRSPRAALSRPGAIRRRRRRVSAPACLACTPPARSPASAGSTSLSPRERSPVTPPPGDTPTTRGCVSRTQAQYVSRTSRRGSKPPMASVTAGPNMVTHDTLVCRCEEVTYGHLCVTAESTGSRSLRALKLSTRAGLGYLPGPDLRAQRRDLDRRMPAGKVLGDVVSTDRRPIAAPIRLGELAENRLRSSRPLTTHRTSHERNPMTTQKFDLGGVIVATTLAFKEDASAPAGPRGRLRPVR